VELPICNTIYAILYEEADADAALRTLFTRSVKGEFDS
jgi:glycerol-3-phosphate dehydrogenase (NAD(P)+)